MARVLVIDDDEDTCDLFSTILRNAGHVVQVALDGEQGLRVFTVWKPDIVVVDMFMPEMDGLETVSAMRRASSPVKVIAVSAGYRFHGRDGGGDVVDRALELGADVALRKPVEPEQLERAVDTVMGSPPGP